MGYGHEQISELQKAIDTSDADLVIIATPIDLRRVIKVTKPIERVRYALQPIGSPTLADMLAEKFAR
jgi:predicted GTPase